MEPEYGPISVKQWREHRILRSGRPLRTHAGEPISELYRFFPERWQAEALCAGKVWITTLETCRNYEDAAQGDSLEGHEHYNSGHIQALDANDPRIKVLAHHGILIQDCYDISVDNLHGQNRLVDAFVLCTTLTTSAELSPAIGKYGVRISQPIETFFDITERLLVQRPLGQASFDVVRYCHLEYEGLQSPPGMLGFVKRPVDHYIAQQEARMLWIPVDDDPMMPFCLEVPEISGRCELLY
jgi:hypothetical protein